MVSQAFSFSKTGVSDWFIQRVSAVILAVYSLVIVGFCLLQGEMTFAAWSGLFATTWMQVFTLVVILATCAHAWIGMWTIGTDYIRPHTMGAGANARRYYYQVICLIITGVYLVWGVRIIWGS